jgi:hypothetical protein
MISVYMLFSYPVRNALRYYWLAVYLFLAVDFARRRFPKDKRALGAVKG